MGRANVGLTAHTSLAFAKLLAATCIHARALATAFPTSNAGCNNGKCSCDPGYGWKSGVCMPCNDGTKHCSSINDCYDQTVGIAVCSSSNKCDCVTGSWNPTTLRCRKPNDGIQTCTDLDDCKDSRSASAICTGGFRCDCNPGYRWVASTSMKCLADNSGSYSCTDLTDCYDHSAAGLCPLWVMHMRDE